MDNIKDRFDDLNYHWGIYAKNYGYSEQSRSVLYQTYKAGWLAAKTEDKRIVKGGEEWRLLDNDQA
jgi:hypothetical protein